MEMKHGQPDVKTPVVLSKFIPFPGAQTELMNAPKETRHLLIKGLGN